jgi:large subunit ribosomal protein L7/L12
MKPKKKKPGSVLISIGCFFLLVAAIWLYNPNRVMEKKMSGALVWITLGLPLVGLGNWRGWRASQQEQKAKSDRLVSAFYRLLQQSNGQITVLDFAMATELPAQEAKEYLDEKAKEFDAYFLVTEGNGICYQFETRKLGENYLSLN